MVLSGSESMTVKEIMAVTGSRRTAIYKKVVDLRSEGLIDGEVDETQTLPHRPSVRYRITDAGRAVLAEVPREDALKAFELLDRMGDLRLT